MTMRFAIEDESRYNELLLVRISMRRRCDLFLRRDHRPNTQIFRILPSEPSA